MNIFKHLTFIFSVTVLLGCFVFFLQHVGVKKDQNTIIVGTSADYPPYAFVDIKTGQVVGFDIDVAREVVRRLDKECVIEDMPFTTLIFDLLAQEIDIIAAGLTPTPRKAKNVHFSQLYLQGDPLIALTKKGASTITSIQDLEGKKVVVNTGYTADLYLSDKPNIELVRLKSPAESFMALKSGSVDAFVAARSSLVTFLKKEGVADRLATFVLPETGDSYALAINKNNETLLDDVNKVLFAMQQDGTLQALKKKWSLDD